MRPCCKELRTLRTPGIQRHQRRVVQNGRHRFPEIAACRQPLFERTAQLLQGKHRPLCADQGQDMFGMRGQVGGVLIRPGGKAGRTILGRVIQPDDIRRSHGPADQLVDIHIRRGHPGRHLPPHVGNGEPHITSGHHRQDALRIFDQIGFTDGMRGTIQIRHRPRRSRAPRMTTQGLDITRHLLFGQRRIKHMTGHGDILFLAGENRRQQFLRTRQRVRIIHPALDGRHHDTQRSGMQPDRCPHFNPVHPRMSQNMHGCTALPLRLPDRLRKTEPTAEFRIIPVHHHEPVTFRVGRRTQPDPDLLVIGFHHRPDGTCRQTRRGIPSAQPDTIPDSEGRGGHLNGIHWSLIN